MALNNVRRVLDGAVKSEKYSKVAGYLNGIDRYIR